MSSFSFFKLTSIKINSSKSSRNYRHRNNNKKAWKTRRLTVAWFRVIARLFMKGYSASHLSRLFRVSVGSVYVWAAKYCKYKVKKQKRSVEVEMVTVTKMRFA